MPRAIAIITTETGGSGGSNSGALTRNARRTWTWRDESPLVVGLPGLVMRAPRLTFDRGNPVGNLSPYTIRARSGRVQRSVPDCVGRIPPAPRRRCHYRCV